MDHLKFVISASEAESVAQSLGFPSVLHLLPTLVQPAQSLARPPISKFPVGAVGLGSDGRVFIGVNLEFPGLPLNQSVHAEQFLCNNLAVHGCPRLIALAVSAAPCGHCRQFFQELRDSSSLQILITSDHPNQNFSKSPLPFKPLPEFLTNPFGPCDLLDKESPLLLEPHSNGLSFDTSRKHANLCNGYSKESELDGNFKNLSNGFYGDLEESEALLRIEALEAANKSHAPYSGCPSGVALMDPEGKVYRGSYIESAAYNPSLGPVQAALAAYIAWGGGGYERIVAAALVEREGAKVSHEDTARLLFKRVSPKCEFRVYHCSSVENGCKKSSE
ncbi:cytidine deaminase 1-like [Coffea arabica]|uniref:cytidine deaminase n=1 Tax=Coffea arabica TaxID=13443 RepID=A0ABM4UNK8_COFAR|nr:cytidine deaminase 1-like [Coffea arabica]